MTEVTIVGGGLAGMTAALRLAELGERVTLIEAAARLGGKSGADRGEHGLLEDHGYHVFPGWYRNTWALIDELGIRDDLVGCNEFNHLVCEPRREHLVVRNMASIRNLRANLTSGLLPFADLFLFYYAVLDLVSRAYDDRALLDQISLNGFLHSRFYRTERVAWQLQRMLTRAVAAPTYQVSAQTVARSMRYFISYPVPAYSVLRGNMQDYFIEPFRRSLEKAGCALELSTCLERLEVEGRRVRRLHLRDASGRRTARDVERAVLALPCERMAELVDDEVYAAAPKLGRIRELRTRAYATLHVHFRRAVPGVPRSHVALFDSRFNLSFIDVAQIWDDLPGTALNVIVSDQDALGAVSDDVFKSEVFGELRRYLPELDPADVTAMHLDRHARSPLFMNDVGNWHDRPGARTELANLYLAGDYCRSPVDLASMEGAIHTALAAVNAFLEDSGRSERVKIELPEVPSRARLVALRLALAPFAALGKLAALADRSDRRIGRRD